MPRALPARMTSGVGRFFQKMVLLSVHRRTPAALASKAVWKGTKMRRRALLAGLTVGSFASDAADKPLLLVGGRIGKRNAGDAYAFTDDEFMRLPQSTIVTGTAWTPKSLWSGPRLSAVMAHVEAETSERLRIGAVDDYYVGIPWEDMARWGIVLAHSRDGRRLERRLWGPLFLIYPRDDNRRELSTPMTEAKFVWQVTRIDVE